MYVCTFATFCEDTSILNRSIENQTFLLSKIKVKNIDILKPILGQIIFGHSVSVTTFQIHHKVVLLLCFLFVCLFFLFFFLFCFFVVFFCCFFLCCFFCFFFFFFLLGLVVVVSNFRNNKVR